MTIWQTIGDFFSFGRAGRRAVGYQQGSAGSTRTQSNNTVDEEVALSLSTVYACVRVLAETTGALPVRGYKLSADGTPVIDTRHPLARLFAGKVNKYQTANEYWETLVAQEALHGNSYSLISRLNDDRPDSEIISLMPLMAGQMRPRLLPDGDMSYEYTVDGKLLVLSADRIWHTKQFGNGVVGYSTLSYAAESAGLALAANRRAGIFARNGHKPAGILMIDKLLKPEQREAIRAEFSSLVVGDEDPLKVLEAGMTYQSVSVSPADAQLLESRRFQLEELCRFFGVPPVMIGDSSGSTTWGSGIQALMSGFYGITLRPRLERLEASINNNLLSAAERGRYRFQFDAEALLRMDPGARATRVKEHVQAGLLTPNEARLEMGYGRSTDPAADQLYAQAQLVKLGTGSVSAVAIPTTGAPA